MYKGILNAVNFNGQYSKSEIGEKLLTIDRQRLILIRNKPSKKRYNNNKKNFLSFSYKNMNKYLNRCKSYVKYRVTTASVAFKLFI